MIEEVEVRDLSDKKTELLIACDPETRKRIINFEKLGKSMNRQAYRKEYWAILRSLKKQQKIKK